MTLSDLIDAFVALGTISMAWLSYQHIKPSTPRVNCKFTSIIERTTMFGDANKRSLWMAIENPGLRRIILRAVFIESNEEFVSDLPLLKDLGGNFPSDRGKFKSVVYRRDGEPNRKVSWFHEPKILEPGDAIELQLALIEDIPPRICGAGVMTLIDVDHRAPEDVIDMLNREPRDPDFSDMCAYKKYPRTGCFDFPD